MERIEVKANISGVTHSRGGNRFITLSAGYLGRIVLRSVSRFFFFHVSNHVVVIQGLASGGVFS